MTKLCEQSKGRPLEQLRHGSPAGNQSSNSGLCNGLANNSSSGTYSRIDRNSSSAKASGTGTVPQNLNGCTLFIHDGFNGISARHSSQRDAALTKFRLKRKDRCYDKKVRYQSRKSLAEQRPRVKGQFVRQVKNETKDANADGCP